MAAMLLQTIATTSTTYDQRFDPADLEYRVLLDFHNSEMKPNCWKTYKSTENDGHVLAHADQVTCMLVSFVPAHCKGHISIDLRCQLGTFL